MGGKGGSVDTSGMTNAMNQETAIASKQMDLANQEFQYGTQRTAKYADPVLNEFMRIMGFGGAAATPAAASAPAAGGASGGAGGGTATPNMFTTPTGQVVSGTPYAAGDANAPSSNIFMQGSSYYYSDPATGNVQPLTPVPQSGTRGPDGIGAAVPWGGGTTGATTATGGRYVSPLESSMFQLPIATSQAQAKQAKASIMRNTPPGAQQTAMLTQVDNQMNQSLGQSAFGTVNNMLNALLGTSSAATTGMSQASTTMAQAGQTTAAAGSMASTIANLQAQAQASNNQMLGGIFSTIGGLLNPLASMMGGGGGSSAGLTSGVSDSMVSGLGLLAAL